MHYLYNAEGMAAPIWIANVGECSPLARIQYMNNAGAEIEGVVQKPLTVSEWPSWFWARAKEAGVDFDPTSVELGGVAGKLSIVAIAQVTHQDARLNDGILVSWEGEEEQMLQDLYQNPVDSIVLKVIDVVHLTNPVPVSMLFRKATSGDVRVRWKHAARSMSMVAFSYCLHVCP